MRRESNKIDFPPCYLENEFPIRIFVFVTFQNTFIPAVHETGPHI